MASVAKQILERAIAKGLLTKEQAIRLARDHHRKKEEFGGEVRIEELAAEQGLITEEQASRLRDETHKFLADREIAGYRLLQKIGSGSMGTVYKAVQVSLDRIVAIKILSPHLAHKPGFVERFLREARTVARLNHPNVISGIDAGEAEGYRYFVMEYASGLPIGKLLKRGGPMAESRVLRIAIQITRALEHAHEAGLVHRDVKPDNILVKKDGVAKLCDLGLAKDRPEEGKSMGTPDYISPEQARGDSAVDIRSDLYSFGATLYHMLTGRPPFEGNAKVVMTRHCFEAPRNPSEIDPDISPDMEAIVLRLLEKEPADRYQTPAELLVALQELQKEGPSRRRSTSAAPTPSRRRRRR